MLLKTISRTGWTPEAYVARATKAEWSGELVCEHPPVGESKSNGRLENTIRNEQAQFRTAKDGSETNTRGGSHEIMNHSHLV